MDDAKVEAGWAKDPGANLRLPKNSRRQWLRSWPSHNVRIDTPLSRASYRNPGTNPFAFARPGCNQDGSGTSRHCPPTQFRVDFPLHGLGSRRFQGLTLSSPILQHKRDLFSSGLVENPCSPCDFAQRRKLCEEHKRKWSSVGKAVMTVHESPRELKQHSATVRGRNLIALRNFRHNSLHFLRLPSVANRKPIEWWSIPTFPFRLRVFAVYLPDSILVAAEEK